MSQTPTKIVLARGDGIGPEISKAVVKIMDAAGAKLDIHEAMVGEQAYAAGYDGIEPGTAEKVKDCGIMLKAPMGTPSGGGHKSLNLMLRQQLGLWANVRPAVSYPQLVAPQSDVHMTVFRENTEGLYVGLTKDLGHQEDHYFSKIFGADWAELDYNPNDGVSFALQVISDRASERIIRAAFDYARANGSEEVHAISKPNILKATDGRFKRWYETLGKEFSDVSSRFSILDIGMANTAAYPVNNGIVVTQNLYGDSLSDVMGLQVHGSLGLAPSVNIGGTQDAPMAMFEAVHGTAPDIAGKGIANPSAFLLSAIMMLRFAGQEDTAAVIHNALMKTWEDGKATGDVYLNKDHETDAEFNALFERLTGDAGGMPYLTEHYKTRNAMRELWDNRFERQSERGSMNTATFTNAVIGNLGQAPSEAFEPNYMKDDYRALLPAPK